jgi:hypothetical protein
VSFPLWNSPHSVHFPFFSYTYGNPILQPVSFHIHAGMGDTLTSPIFPFKRSTSNGLQTYPFSFHTLAHSLARSKTQLICFQAIAHSLPQNTGGGGAQHVRCEPHSSSSVSLAGACELEDPAPQASRGPSRDGMDMALLFNCQLSTYRVQRISSFFSTCAKSRSLVAREALRATARAAAKPST